MNPKVDAYLENSELWPGEIAALRPILLGCGLTEELKWGKPCYSADGKNIAIMQEMKNFLALMFFKGALLDDPDGLLQSQGPNSRSALRLCFTSVDQVRAATATVEGFVRDAIEVERAGLEVEPAPEVAFVAELERRIAADSNFAAAFAALTPGRQREYNLHFADAKQSSTREARIEKHATRILAGKGLRDR